MPNDNQRPARKATHALVQLLAGDYHDNVLCGNLTAEGCSVTLNRTLNPKTLVHLRFYAANTQAGPSELFDPLVGEVRWYRPADQPGWTGRAGLAFKSKATVNHGVPQLLNPEYFRSRETKKLTTPNRSLMAAYARCLACGREEVPQYKLRVKSMVTKTNIFGLPIYVQPLAGMDFCDFNLLRVTVCPSCLFASHLPEYFQRDRETPSPFNERAFAEKWGPELEGRRMFIDNLKEGFNLDTRSLEQAILAHQLAVDAHRALARLEDEVFHNRQVALLLMHQAELLMSKGAAEAAWDNLKSAAARLERTLPKMRGAALVRSSLLVALVRLYFQDLAPFGQYMAFLAGYDREGKIDPESEEGRALKTAKAALRRAFDNREQFSHEKLDSFFMEF